MTAPFTAVDDWSSLQDTACANEIISAYNERRQARGQSTTALLSPGDNAQDTAFWRGLQEWIEGDCVAWIDHVAGPINEAGDGLRYWTLAGFRAAAGLHPDGFRRSTDGATFSHGPIQSGDIRGPWIFEDLQAALSALKWTAAEMAWDSGSILQGIYTLGWYLDGPYWDIVKPAVEAAYDAAVPSEPGNPLAYSRLLIDTNYPFRPWRSQGEMKRGKARPKAVAPSSVTHKYSIYVVGSKIPHPNHPFDESMYDDNGDGISEGISFLSETGDMSETEWVGDEIGGVARPAWCDEPPMPPDWTGYAENIKGYQAGLLGVLKWAFTLG